MPVPFRICVFTDEISQDLERVVQVCKDYEIRGIELRALWDKQPHLLSEERALEYGRRLDGEGCVTVGVASPFYKCKLGDDDAIGKHHDILRRCIDLMHRLRAPMVRGFTFWREGAFDEERCKRVAGLFEKPISILEEMDATLLIENEAACSVGTGKETRSLLDRLNHPRVRSVWDPGNGVWVAGSEKPYPDGYLAQKRWQAHVHVKDTRLGADGKHACVKMGDGEVDWPGQLRALRDDGYAGWISMETHWQGDLPAPAGAGPRKQSREESTRICLDVLTRWVGEL